MVKPEEVPNLNDEELMKVLKQAGLNKGPLTSTTRSLYEKKLIKFLKESKLPEENLAPSKTPSKTTKTVEKPKPAEPLKESNKNETITFTPKSTVIEQVVHKTQSARPNLETIHPKTSITKPVQEPFFNQQRSEPVPIRQVQQEPTFSHYSDMAYKKSESINYRTQEPSINRPAKQPQEETRYSNFNSSQKTDSIQIRPAQETRIMYATNSSSVPKQQSIFAPPLNVQRERNHSKDSYESRNKPMFDKFEKPIRESQLSSSKTGNSTLPLEFKLINKEEESKNMSASGKVLEERPFLGYIKTDRQVEQQNYILNRRSIIKLDKAGSLREQNKSPELYSKPIIDLSPRLDGPNEKREHGQVTSSITITKIEKTNHADWLKNNLKYLFSVFVVTVIVFYFLQSSEEENPLFE